MLIQHVMTLTKQIAQDLCDSAGVTLPADLTIKAEHPASSEHGEYSLNVAMQLARHVKRAPLLIAQDIREQLWSDVRLRGAFHRIEVAQPGFINLHRHWQSWAGETEEPTRMESVAHEKVLIEHTSINPNKSAHIGHLRNSCIGDTLARMLKRAGHRVEVHNYIDDLGNQLADTVVGMLHTKTEEAHRRFGDFCWDTYAKVNRAYQEDSSLQQERTRVLHQLEEGDNNIAWLGQLVAERIVTEHVVEMKAFGIRYDVLVWESSILREGLWTETFEQLRGTEVMHQETAGKLSGCWVLKQPRGSSDEEPQVDGESQDQQHQQEQQNQPGQNQQHQHHADKVLVRSNGILTYTAKDIAYHLWKFGKLQRDFRYRRFGDRLWSTSAEGARRKVGHADRVINVIDHRQEYPQAMVKQALLALGYESEASKLQHVSYGVVSLSPATALELGIDISEGRSSYPMSGRQGIGIKVAAILDGMERVVSQKRSRRAGLSSRVIAAAAIRYYLLRFHLQTEVVFDTEQATEISGNTGVYLLYTHARACSLLDKGNGEPLQADDVWLAGLQQQEHNLLRHLAYWPEVLQAAAAELSPTPICSYAYELASLFNHYYAACPILKEEGARRASRLWLTQQAQRTLQDALEVLGLPAPRRM
ncbi:arginine--tRNA ligase [Paenibacillus sp. GCM10023252]|uniref:arginine--tRNA ligase n=1 Tax=Paenibacillus sp. GCM10023252 TaxID=3252649 RepID=UPI003606A8FE